MPFKSPEMKKEYQKQYRKKNRKQINETIKDWLKKNPDKYLNIKTRWNINNQEKRMLDRVRSRAKILKVDFNLSLEDIKIPEYCPILGVKIQYDHKKATSPSLDRIDPLGGYTKDNVQIICNKANMMKNNATKEQLLKFAHWIIDTYSEDVD